MGIPISVYMLSRAICFRGGAFDGQNARSPIAL